MDEKCQRFTRGVLFRRRLSHPLLNLQKTITAPHRLTGRKPLEYLTSASSVVPKALNQIKVMDIGELPEVIFC